MRYVMILCLAALVGCGYPDSFELADATPRDVAADTSGDATPAYTDTAMPDASADVTPVDAPEGDVAADAGDAAPPDVTPVDASDASADVADASDAAPRDASADAATVDDATDAGDAAPPDVADASDAAPRDVSAPDASADVPADSAGDAAPPDAVPADASTPDAPLTPDQRCRMATTCDACLAMAGDGGMGCGWCGFSARCTWGYAGSPEVGNCGGAWVGTGRVCR